jgi:NAD(P)-dependent dehydrogenase (short-subunit alcohol dehydrogenase family)
MSRLAGKIALVTGGASGLGEAICRRYAHEGATVFVSDVDAAGGRAVAGSIGAGAAFVPLDVTRKPPGWTRWRRCGGAAAASTCW